MTIFDAFKGIPKHSVKVEHNEYRKEYFVSIWNGFWWSVIDKYGRPVEFDTVGSMTYYEGSIWKDEEDSSEINNWQGVIDRIETYYIKMQEKQADKQERKVKDKWVEVTKEPIKYEDIPSWLESQKRALQHDEKV